MPVYLLSAEGEPGRIKIGFASDVGRRIASLQASTWRSLNLIRTVPGDHVSEAWFHNRFRELHIAREWFHFHPDMLILVPCLDDSHRRIPNRTYDNVGTPRAPMGFHADVIRQLGGTTRLAAEMGLTKNVLSKWAVRGIPSRHWLKIAELATASGMALTAADLDRTKPNAAFVPNTPSAGEQVAA